VLVPIDLQKAFDDPRMGPRNNRGLEENVKRVLEAARNATIPIIHVRHASVSSTGMFHPSKEGHQFKPEGQPHPAEPIVTKNVNAAFIGTDLERRLRDLKADPVFFLGLMTDHCVSTTARMAGNLGINTVVIGDACATFPRVGTGRKTFDAQLVHDVELASLKDEFAAITTTDAFVKALKLG
jgi:nicotinamidase-related amidase